MSYFWHEEYGLGTNNSVDTYREFEWDASKYYLAGDELFDEKEELVRIHWNFSLFGYGLDKLWIKFFYENFE